VSLGKLGRVEVLPQTTMKLSFTDDSVSVSMLDAGRVRVSSSSNVNASTTTNDGHIIATARQRNEFIVDTSCGNTFVAVKKGNVELRAGTDANTVKQIAAGNQDTAGTARPGCTPAP
jgi:ferric-dicitrate binding protein FerR (iron transport regulator)